MERRRKKERDKERERERGGKRDPRPFPRFSICGKCGTATLVLPYIHTILTKSFGPLRMGRDPGEQITLFICRTGRATAERSSSFLGDENAWFMTRGTRDCTLYSLLYSPLSLSLSGFSLSLFLSSWSLFLLLFLFFFETTPFTKTRYPPWFPPCVNFETRALEITRVSVM